MFLNISSNPALNVSLILNTSHDNNNLYYAIVMQEKRCSGFVKHVMDANSIFFLVWSKIYL